MTGVTDIVIVLGATFDQEDSHCGLECFVAFETRRGSRGFTGISAGHLDCRYHEYDEKFFGDGIFRQFMDTEVD